MLLNREYITIRTYTTAYCHGQIAGVVDIVNKEVFKNGYSIVVIEHKILDGMIEAGFSLHPETKHNDKLSPQTSHMNSGYKA